MNSFCHEYIVLGQTICRSTDIIQDSNISNFLLHLDLKYRMAPFENKTVETAIIYKDQRTVKSEHIATNEKKVYVNDKIYWIDRIPTNISNVCTFDHYPIHRISELMPIMFKFNITKEDSDDILTISSSYIHNVTKHCHFGENILPSRLMIFFELPLNKPYQFDHVVLKMLIPINSSKANSVIQYYQIIKGMHNIDNLELKVENDQYQLYVDKSFLKSIIYSFKLDCIVKHNKTQYIQGHKGYIFTYSLSENQNKVYESIFEKGVETA